MAGFVRKSITLSALSALSVLKSGGQWRPIYRIGTCSNANPFRAICIVVVVASWATQRIIFVNEMNPLGT